jgi:hypothetical protein
LFWNRRIDDQFYSRFVRHGDERGRALDVLRGLRRGGKREEADGNDGDGRDASDVSCDNREIGYGVH